MLHQQMIPEKKKKRSLKDKRSMETGFPSPATDHLEDRLNLHDYIVHNEAATYFCRIRGNQDEAFGLFDGDLLIIDRSLAYKHHSLVIAMVDGEHRVSRLWNKGDRWSLQFSDTTFHHLERSGDAENLLWGVISHVVHSCL